MEELIYIKDVLEIFWYGDPTVPVKQGFIQFIGLAISVASSLMGAAAAKKQANNARDRRRAHQNALKKAEEGRQDIVDPSKGIKSLAGMISNPYANLQVATKAAEMQAEETDLSLASSLDTLRATGASAGGATALAQAALRSKQGISASIEKQEADNSRLRAQGQAQTNQLMVQDAARVQAGRAQGQQFMFGAREKREQQQLNRLSALASNAQAQEATSRMASQQMLYQGLGQVGGALMTMDKSDFKFGGGGGGGKSAAGNRQLKRLTGKGSTMGNEGIVGDFSDFTFNSDPTAFTKYANAQGLTSSASAPSFGSDIVRERSGFYNWITGGDGSSGASDPLGTGGTRNYLFGKGRYKRKKGD